jgi:hypothetical protein
MELNLLKLINRQKMENQITIIDPKEFGLEEKQANKMTAGLDVIINERQALEAIYNEVILKELNKATFKEAKELLSKVRDNRTKGIEVWHKTNKAFYLAGGRFVDAYKNKEVSVNEQMESKLTEIVKYEENLERERKAALKSERIALLNTYGTDVQFIALDEMNADQFDLLLEREKLAHEARIESARVAEVKRIADEKAENERIESERLAEVERLESQRLENVRLKDEADKLAKEIEAERLENARLAKIESDKLAKEQAENEMLQKIASDLAKQIQEAEQAKIRAELFDKKEADKLAKAPMKNRMNVWIDTFTHGLPIDNETSKDILIKFASFKKWAKSEIDKL